MALQRKTVAMTVAYMAGLNEEKLEQHYDVEEINVLRGNKDATIIRYLSQIRTTLFLKFKQTNNLMKYDLKNLNSIEWYNSNAIAQLEKWGIPVIKPNYTSHQYIEDINLLIKQKINNCSNLFDEWVNFDYIKDLFVIPTKKKGDIQVKEFKKFIQHLNFYPFQLYIHWEPVERGNIFLNDQIFLETLYEQHKETFSDISKTVAVEAETKDDIYKFIEESGSVILAVDCENSNVFKLYSILKEVKADDFVKIRKIMLFDDAHTPDGWEWLSKFTHIPVEYTQVERLLNYKSLVDMKITTGVCAEHYKNGVDSFILCSSDSDFWGLISSLPEARFLVMHEKEQCSPTFTKTLNEHGISNCCMDDFYTGNATQVKNAILLDKLRNYIPNIIGMNGMELAKRIFTETKLKATSGEIEQFYNKYIKTMRLKINSDGVFYIDNDNLYLEQKTKTTKLV